MLLSSNPLTYYLSNLVSIKGIRKGVGGVYHEQKGLQKREKWKNPIMKKISKISEF